MLLCPTARKKCSARNLSILEILFMKLAQLSSLIRSKNAGPFILTFDIMFPDEQSYLLVKRSGVLNAAVFAKLYRSRPEAVRFFEFDNPRPSKFSLPRDILQVALGTRDR